MTHLRFSRFATASILLLMAAAAAMLVWLRRPQDDPAPPAPSPPNRAMVLTGLIDRSLKRTAATAQPAASVPPVLALMPFSAPDQDETLAGIGEAMCEAILERLGPDGAPPTSACNSARVASQVGMSPTEIGRLLGVRSLLTGSLVRDGDRFKVRARMIAAADGRELWLHETTVAPDELHDLSTQLVQRIVNPAAAGTTATAPAAPEPGTDVRVPPGEAYALYIRALHQRRLGGREHALEARRLLDQALALAPDYPPALLASVALNSNLVALGVGSGADVDAQVRDVAQHLRRVNPDGPEAVMTGSSAAVGARQWSEALQLLDRGAAAYPQHTALKHTQAGVLMMMGYVRRSRDVAHQVALREPLNASSHERLARAYALLGDDAHLLEAATLARELGWKPQTAAFFGLLALRQANVSEAERVWHERLAAAQMPVDWIGPVLRARLDPTHRPAAVTAIEALPADARAAMNHMFLAYGLAGDTDRSLAALQTARADVASMWVTDLWLPEMAAVRRDPRFVAWARDMGLVDLWESHGPPDLCQRASEGAWQCG
jgi:TolB-like protein